ncbi:ABC transporter ATP-binding protein [Botrimarina mediterranea]|uniref:Macrolide export ATP-binding/permease protein MacB n=1 Tax=Botrimarina mediterranea TaxID=2528022 RepID=A0A518KBG3_9BACT|nr:ABC transporter ATP-binding protein [Botrimarina mediterranea]QDV75136.1 Macrolide export ATP-binding/permease protein MacB [Botrimarina mediterranea]QDV79782.1 Macrolide export ATP-binding/permease protein MacB [Planctomycetes bacterium K2D]
MPTTTEHTSSDASTNTLSPAVVVRGVTKSFARGDVVTNVLKSVDLTIEQGECLFLLGPSGSGKTTLMSIIGCLLTPDTGTVKVLGRDIPALTLSERADLRRREVGFVFQRFNLIRGLTAAENVGAPLRLDGVSERDARRRAVELLERVGLGDRANESPERMSVGQCQRVAVARALVADPQIVLADEPTASLDAQSGQQAMRLLRELTVEAGKTLVVVTHDHRIVPAGVSVDRIVAMDSGRLVESPS